MTPRSHLEHLFGRAYFITLNSSSRLQGFSSTRALEVVLSDLEDVVVRGPLPAPETGNQGQGRLGLPGYRSPAHACLWAYVAHPESAEQNLGVPLCLGLCDARE